MGFVSFMRSFAGRVLRVAAGVVIIWIALTQVQPPWSWIVMILGVVPILAGLMNFCLLGPLFNADFWGRPRHQNR